MRSYHTLQEALVQIEPVVVQALSVLAVSGCFLDRCDPRRPDGSPRRSPDPKMTYCPPSPGQLS